MKTAAMDFRTVNSDWMINGLLGIAMVVNDVGK
jgi:hypothetical protein